jgi:hypothetical protein
VRSNPQIGQIQEVHESPSPSRFGLGNNAPWFRVLADQADAGFPELVASLNHYWAVCFVAANRFDSLKFTEWES